jgi:hypothetical protein
MKSRVKLLDIVIIILAAGVCFLSAYGAYMKPSSSSRVLIQSKDSEWYFPADASETLVVSGPLGDTVIKIEEGRAWVEDSPCENKTCIASGFVARQGQWAACLPNKVLLFMEGKGSDDVDTLAW